MNTENTPQDMSLRSWLALFILALSTFTIVTTELAPVGLLTPIAEGLRSSESAVGMTVSLYAWVGALSALVASVFLGNIAKKRLLLTLTVILFLSNVLAISGVIRCCTVRYSSFRRDGYLGCGRIRDFRGLSDVGLTPGGRQNLSGFCGLRFIFQCRYRYRGICRSLDGIRFFRSDALYRIGDRHRTFCAARGRYPYASGFRSNRTGEIL